MSITRTLINKLHIKSNSWNIAIYKNPSNSDFPYELNTPIKVFKTNSILKKIKGIHTEADPFLYVHNNELYIFYERVYYNRPGSIYAYKSNNLIDYIDLGEILSSKTHLSYPYIFSHQNTIYLIPESSESKEVALYKFLNFPYNPIKILTLLKGEYVDSSFILVNNIWYLFTTSKNGLEIFYTTDFLKHPLQPHPCNPITKNPKIMRSGGNPIEIKNNIFRIAQDCSIIYGGNINILKISNLSTSNYAESTLRSNYFKCDKNWNANGGHHLSTASFQNQIVIAVDGNAPSPRIYKLFSIFNYLYTHLNYFLKKIIK